MISCIIIAREFGKIQKIDPGKPFQENSNSENNQRIAALYGVFARADIILKYTVKMQNIVILHRVKFFFRQFFLVMNIKKL